MRNDPREKKTEKNGRRAKRKKACEKLHRFPAFQKNMEEGSLFLLPRYQD